MEKLDEIVDNGGIGPLFVQLFEIYGVYVLDTPVDRSQPYPDKRPFYEGIFVYHARGMSVFGNDIDSFRGGTP